MPFRREKGTLYFSQNNYIEKLLERFRMKDAKGHFTPDAQKQQISKSDIPGEDGQE